jgi:hypothetical protein
MVIESLDERNFLYHVFSLKEEEIECVKGELVVMCEEMLFMEANMCKQKSMEGSYL